MNVCIDNNPENTPLGYESRVAGIILWIGLVVALFAMNVYFYWNQHISVILRRRPFYLVAITSSANAITALTFLWHNLDPQSLPCELFYFVIVHVIPCTVAPFVIRLTHYSNALALEKIKKEEKFARGDFLAKQTSDRDAGWAYFKSIFNKKNCTDEEKALSLVFQSRSIYAYLWIAVCTLPFSVQYFVRLGGVPYSWVGCYACTTDLYGAVFAIAMMAIILNVGVYFSVTLLLQDRQDVLFYVREFVLSWIVGGSFALLAVILHLVDPGEYKKQRKVDWFWLSIPGLFAMTYFPTVFQVMRAKRNLKRMMVNMNKENIRTKVGAGEILEDIKRNKDMKNSLMQHMEKELSSELFRFILAVDEWKQVPDGEAKQTQARLVFREFIQPRAILEVNISHATRSLLLEKFESGNQIGEDAFDVAVKECTTMLVNDSLPRFIAKQARTLVDASKNKSVAPIDYIP